MTDFVWWAVSLVLSAMCAYLMIYRYPRTPTFWKMLSFAMTVGFARLALASAGVWR